MRRRQQPEGDGGLRAFLVDRARARIRPTLPSEATGDPSTDVLFGARRFHERKIEQVEAGESLVVWAWELPAELQPSGSSNDRCRVDAAGTLILI